MAQAKQNAKKQSLNKYKIFIALIVFGRIFAGAIQNLILKWQGIFTITYDDGTTVKYNHPWVQLIFMFIGELMNLPIWAIMVAIKKAKGQPLYPPCPVGKRQFKWWPHAFLMLIPMVFDLIQSMLYNMAIYYLVSSVHAMLKNLSIVSIAIISFIAFRHYRMKFDLPQGIGLLLVLGGSFTVGAMGIVFGSKDETAKDPMLGTILILCAVVFAGMYYTSEEFFFTKIHGDPLLVMGSEGLFGLITTLAFIPVIQLVKLNGEPIDDLKRWLQQVRALPIQIGLHIIYAFCTTVTSYTGLCISAHLSSASRGTIDASRIIIIWIVSMAVGWEHWDNISTPVRLLGFILIVMGVLIYNNALKIIPFLKQINIQHYGKCLGRKPKIQPQLSLDDELRKPVLADVSESTELRGSISITAQNSAQIGQGRI